MAEITPSRKNITTEETSFRAAVSESTMQKVGGSINFINERQLMQRDFFLNGPYNIVAPPQTFVDGMVFFPNACTIIAVYMYAQVMGSGGTTELDLIYRATSGSSGSSIFTTTPKITSAATGPAWTYYNNGTSSAPTGCTAPVLLTTSVAANSSLSMTIKSAQTGLPSGTGLVIFYRPTN